MNKITATQVSKKSKRILLILSTLTILFFIFSLLMLNAYIDRVAAHKTQLSEDISFARMETFIDTIKIRLDKEIPKAEWKIEKYCREPGTKGEFDQYSCNYRLISTVNNDYRAKLMPILSTYSSKSVDTINFNGSSELSDLYTSFNHYGCRFYYNINSMFSAVGCENKSTTLQYPLN